MIESSDVETCKHHHRCFTSPKCHFGKPCYAYPYTMFYLNNSNKLEAAWIKHCNGKKGGSFRA